MSALAVIAAGVLGLSIASSPPQPITVRVEPAAALLDAAVVITVEGAPPGAELTLRTSTADANGRPWRGEAVYRASAKGTVDVSRDPALRGSYTGVEPMGLFWSLAPEPGAAAGSVASTAAPRGAPMQDLLVPPTIPPLLRPVGGEMAIRIEVVIDGQTAATAVARRLVTGADVKVTEVREGGLVARLYEPPGTRRPAIAVFGGSEGGIPRNFAPVLAGHGYVTLALAYFREDGLPTDLVEIPLESVKRGIDWLRERPSVDPERVGVLGQSRGGELVLLLGATYPELKTVVAISPSSVVWEGAVRDPNRAGLASLKIDRSAWTLGGRPLPFLPKTVTPQLAARIASGERFLSEELFLPSLADAAAVERARILVERIKAPVLLLSSRADRTWPSAAMAGEVAARLRASGKVEHLTYDAASHALLPGWLPIPCGGSLGGTAKGSADAFADYWPRLLRFLRDALGAPTPAHSN